MEVNEKNNLTKWLKFAFLKAKEKLLGRQFLKLPLLDTDCTFLAFSVIPRPRIYSMFDS